MECDSPSPPPPAVPFPSGTKFQGAFQAYTGDRKIAFHGWKSLQPWRCSLDSSHTGFVFLSLRSFRPSMWLGENPGGESGDAGFEWSAETSSCGLEKKSSRLAGVWWAGRKGKAIIALGSGRALSERPLLLPIWTLLSLLLRLTDFGYHTALWLWMLDDNLYAVETNLAITYDKVVPSAYHLIGLVFIQLIQKW